MAKNTIALKGEFIRKEVEATAAITPGMGVTPSGALASNIPRAAFALENDLIGKGIDDAYAIGDLVQYGVFEPGAEVNALAGAAVGAAGNLLQFDATGRLVTATTGHVVAIALETAAGAGSRFRVEVTYGRAGVTT